jgi:hypothetical protein
LTKATVLTDRFDRALLYATHVHGGQVRKGTSTPYAAHLLAVAATVLEYGGDEDLAIAALLHDSVEDQGGKARLDDVRNRYTEDAVDLCDVFSSFSPQGKASLHEISRVMGLPGKPKGFDGSEVERYFLEGRIKEIADYCETDVVNTYRVWLRYELFCGRLRERASTRRASAVWPISSGVALTAVVQGLKSECNLDRSS